ncbi:hypothetical protein [Tenacibaculum piscium]|uniref:Uncharacterized protein n=1 Tax=Tenacibaculum piscium TaxID=1458515 RepID=A0A2H1YEF5_9FLAO|nr:hypothetical protein [Tenacibaculum piscium]MBE7628431.1 hypothetical protein [Tenacibaculum piscium]SOS73892.1 hypothetical protein TNO020_10002 [Tenacibaculum piscium]
MNKEEKIKKYYKNCYPSNIEYSNKVRDENGNKNNLYFRELTLECYSLWNKEVDKNITFSEETKKYLKIENRQLHYLFNDIFKLFYRVCVFEETPTGEVKNPNRIMITEYDIEKCFSNIDFHSLFISTLIENSQYNEAIAVKGYLLTRINTIITNSKQLFGISLLKSPLAEYFTNYISSLKEAINIDEIKYTSLKETQQEKEISKVSIKNVYNQLNLSIEPKEPQQEKEPTKKEPQQEEEILKEQLFKMQNNLIPKVSIENVYNHFKILTELTNKKDVFYLRNSQLITFIKSTFIDKKPIKQDFNGKPRTKKEVREIFYDFYFNNKNKETNQTSIKRKYFNIMNDSFYGFNKNDYTDFAK